MNVTESQMFNCVLVLNGESYELPDPRVTIIQVEDEPEEID